jgi:hypothetical protein
MERTYPINKQIATYLSDLNRAALERGEIWAVAKTGRKTKKIIGKYASELEALRRARRYRGKAVKVYLCGYDVECIDDLPVIYKEG